MARLRQVLPDGTTAEAAWDVGSGLSLGRAADCDLVLDDEQVSRHHARVFVDGAHCVLEDLGSANGVFVGLDRVARAVVAPGQPFRVGATWFVVEDESSAGVLSPPPAPPRRRRLAAGCALGGCLGLLAAVLVVGLAVYAWKSRSEQRPTVEIVPGSSSASDASASSAAAAAAGPQVAGMSFAEADVLRFTLRIATNPVLTDCASMPSEWAPPLLEVPLAVRVASDGAFALPTTGPTPRATITWRAAAPGRTAPSPHKDAGRPAARRARPRRRTRARSPPEAVRSWARGSATGSRASSRRAWARGRRPAASGLRTASPRSMRWCGERQRPPPSAWARTLKAHGRRGHRLGSPGAFVGERLPGVWCALSAHDVGEVAHETS